MRSKIQAARYRADACARIRSFFAARSVLEVDTPLLSRGASHDFHLDLFLVPLSSEPFPRFLQTSPEPHMKRLLARGYPDIFQIGKAFRLEESGPRHNPEFTLIEWYRHGFSLRRMMEEAVELCVLIAGARTAAFVSYEKAFTQATGLSPFSANREELASHPAVAKQMQQGLRPEDFREVSDLLNFLMSEVVEPGFDPEIFTVVHGFPRVLSSQALPDPENPGASQRFEVFGGGMELGNGYEELRDSGEYRLRFEAENRKRQASGKPVPPLDDRWFKDIGDELPACSGVALGFDRLLQLGMRVASLDALLEFPWKES